MRQLSVGLLITALGALASFSACEAEQHLGGECVALPGPQVAEFGDGPQLLGRPYPPIGRLQGCTGAPYPDGGGASESTFDEGPNAWNPFNTDAAVITNNFLAAAGPCACLLGDGGAEP